MGKAPAYAMLVCFTWFPSQLTASCFRATNTLEESRGCQLWRMQLAVWTKFLGIEAVSRGEAVQLATWHHLRAGQGHR